MVRIDYISLEHVFPYIENNHPNWLIFFRGIQTRTTNRIYIYRHYTQLQAYSYYISWWGWSQQGSYASWCYWQGSYTASITTDRASRLTRLTLQKTMRATRKVTPSLSKMKISRSGSFSQRSLGYVKDGSHFQDPEASYFGVNQFEPCKFGTVLHVYSIFMQMFDGFRATFQAWQISKHLCVKCQHLNMLTLNLPKTA